MQNYPKHVVFNMGVICPKVFTSQVFENKMHKNVKVRYNFESIHKEKYKNSVNGLKNSKGSIISAVSDTTLTNTFAGAYFGSIIDNIYYTEMEKLKLCREIDADIYVDGTIKTFTITKFDTFAPKE